MTLTAFFKGIARVGRTFTIEAGPLRATGAPAVLLGVATVVLAAGAMKALSEHSERLPETLREARALAQTLRPEPAKLPS